MCWQNNLTLYKSNIYSAFATVQNLAFLLVFIINFFWLLQLSKLLPLLLIMEPQCFYIHSFPQEIRKIVKWKHDHLYTFNTNATNITGIRKRNSTKSIFSLPTQRQCVSSTQIILQSVLSKLKNYNIALKLMGKFMSSEILS